MVKTKEVNTEEKILEAAKKVFLHKGMYGSRMQEIADTAGINKAMLHYYYRSKQLLFEAVFRQLFGMMAPKFGAILNAELPLEEKIKNFTFKYISFVNKHPYLPSFLIQELNNNPKFVDELADNPKFPSLENLKKQIDKLVAANQIRPITVEHLFINILSLSAFPVVGASLIKSVGQLDDKSYQKLLEERKTNVADFIIHAIKIEQ